MRRTGYKPSRAISSLAHTIATSASWVTLLGTGIGAKSLQSNPFFHPGPQRELLSINSRERNGAAAL